MIDPTEKCDFDICVRIPSSLRERMKSLKQKTKINYSYEIKKFLDKFVDSKENELKNIKNSKDRDDEIKSAFKKKIGKKNLEAYLELKKLAIKFGCKTQLEDILITHNGYDIFDKMINLVEDYENMNGDTP